MTTKQASRHGKRDKIARLWKARYQQVCRFLCSPSGVLYSSELGYAFDIQSGTDRQYRALIQALEKSKRQSAYTGSQGAVRFVAIMPPTEQSPRLLWS